MMLLEVIPEAPHQVIGQADQCGVVDRWLPFGQVGDEQVADRSAGDRVAVDELGGRALAEAADLPQRGRVRVENPRLPQHSNRRRRRFRAAPHRVFGVQDFQHVTNADIGQHAAFGGDDHRAAKQDVAHGIRCDRPILLAYSAELVEARCVAAVDHVADQLAFLAASQQPCQRRSHHIRADHDQQRAGHQLQTVLGVLFLAAKPLLGMLSPVRAGGVGAAGQPPLLPGLAGLVGEPVQQQRHAPAAGFPYPLCRQLGRRGGDDPIHFPTIGVCGRPIRLGRTRRIASLPIRLCGGGLKRLGVVAGCGLRRGDGLDDGHVGLRVNSTSSVSGR